jgi:hypothetical protein
MTKTLSVFIQWVQIKKKTFYTIFDKKNSFNKFIIERNNELITNTSNLKFLGIMIDNTSWKGHIDKLVPRSRQAYYIIRAVKTYLLQYMLKMIYYAYLHLVVTYGQLFWGNSSHNMQVFRLQKKLWLCLLSIMESISLKILNYMTLKLEITETYFSHNQIYPSKGSSLCWHQDI